MTATLHTATVSAHAWARRWWAGSAGRTAGTVADAIGAPLEVAYRGAVAVRNGALGLRGPVRVENVTVVSVGNLTVGGTGKTPVAAWVCRLLADRGISVALVARGYGSDELALHARWNPDVRVVSGSDRVDAVRRAREGGAEAVVLDDGFQRVDLARDLDLVLLAAEDPFPGRCLPRGPYREPVRALARAHAAIVTRRTAPPTAARSLAEAVVRTCPGLLVASLGFATVGWRSLDGDPLAPPDPPALAVAAVARPEAFRADVVRITGCDVELAAFPDHHDFTEGDVRALVGRAGGRSLAVTEKDAVKLASFAPSLGDVRVLIQTPVWETGGAEIAARILSVVEGAR